MTPQIAQHLKELLEQQGHTVTYITNDHSPIILVIDGKRTEYARTLIYIKDDKTYIQRGLHSRDMYQAEDFADPNYFNKIIAQIPPPIAFWKVPYYRLKHNLTFHTACAGLICFCYNDHCLHLIVKRHWWHWGIERDRTGDIASIGFGPLFIYFSPYQ